MRTVNSVFPEILVLFDPMHSEQSFVRCPRTGSRQYTPLIRSLPVRLDSVLRPLAYL